ncbi:DUF4222 domain-containing protein [Sodalis ligni]|uniref:DUF4222 domain-containing protein n=1 Tax=Sodalis ligni TaxID=2697027 RepID=UPI00193FF8F8|nr:DUF4222 domain-containing protein [Sodalis ligni]QWA09820.1 DUF4222 domain-containing protein [Sodalis ligni]
MDENRVPVDRSYRDQYGVTVHVIGWDRERQRVIFLRDGYEHECMQPVEQFRKKFTGPL